QTRLRAGLTACAVGFVLCSCAPTGNSALVGKWKEKDVSGVTEFRADGTFSMASGSGKLTGRFKWVDGDHVKLTFDGAVGQVVGASTWKVVVNSETLELTDPEGQTMRCQRQK